MREGKKGREVEGKMPVWIGYTVLAPCADAEGIGKDLST